MASTALGGSILAGIAVILCIALCLFWGKRSVFDFRLKNCCFSKGILAEILKIGVPTLLFQLLTSLSIALINSSAAGYGEAVMAAMGVVTRIMSMGSLMVFGFLKGLQPVAGYSYGSKNYKRLHEAIRISILWSTAFCLVFGLAAAVFSETVIAGFILGACRQGICFVPAIFLLPMVWGVKGVFYAQPLADVLSAGAAVFIAVSIRRQLR